MYKINLDKDATKFLKKLKRGEKELIIRKIEKLRQNPFLGKRLSGNLYGYWSLRFDKFKVIYKILENQLIIIIVEIGHRKEIYK